MTRRRLTVAEAAGELGISQDAVRMRIKRGTLEAERDGRQVFVLLDTAGSGVGSHPDSTALISRLEDEVRFLREELARKDAILLRMAESIPQIEAPRESPESRGPTETPTEGTRAPQSGWESLREPEEAEPRPAVESMEAQESPEMAMPEAGGGPQRPSERPWWRRMFGG